EEYAKKEAVLMEQIREAEKAVEKAKTKEELALKEVQEAKAKAEELSLAVTKAEKEILIAGSPEITEFKVHFNGCRDLLDKMSEIITNLKIDEKIEDAEKLTKALNALCTQAQID
ncbi:MAG: hypothetical protein RR385_09830, partial [Clostridiales bacterium]